MTVSAAAHAQPATRDVDDREPPVPEADPGSHVETLAVRSARGERARHQAERTLVDGAAVTVDDTDDSAHGSLTSSAMR